MPRLDLAEGLEHEGLLLLLLDDPFEGNQVYPHATAPVALIEERLAHEIGHQDGVARARATGALSPELSSGRAWAGTSTAEPQLGQCFAPSNRSAKQRGQRAVASTAWQ